MRHFCPTEPNCLLLLHEVQQFGLKERWRCQRPHNNYADGKFPKWHSCHCPWALPATRGRSTTQGCFLKHTQILTPTQTVLYCICTLNDTWWTISGSSICSFVLAASNCEPTGRLTMLNDLRSVAHTLLHHWSSLLTACCPFMSTSSS